MLIALFNPDTIDEQTGSSKYRSGTWPVHDNERNNNVGDFIFRRNKPLGRGLQELPVNMLPRRRQCKIIIATSLFWIFVDFVLLMYYTAPCVGPKCQQPTNEDGSGPIKRIIDRANKWMNELPEERKQMGKILLVQLQKLHVQYMYIYLKACVRLSWIFRLKCTNYLKK